MGGVVNQGTCSTDTWTKPKGVGSRGGGGVEGHGGLKMETTVCEQHKNSV